MEKMLKVIKVSAFFGIAVVFISLLFVDGKQFPTLSFVFDIVGVCSLLVAAICATVYLIKKKQQKS